MKSTNWNKISIVISDNPESKKYHISTTLLVVVLSVVSILMLAGAGAILYAISLAKSHSWQQTEIQRLQEQNQEQQFKIQGFAGKVSLLDDEMERLENFHAKFKILTQKGRRSKSVVLKGIGGSALDRSAASILPENDHTLQVEKISREFDELMSQSIRQEKNMYEVETFIEPIDTKQLFVPSLHTIPSLLTQWPTAGRIMSGFGFRLSPLTGEQRMHSGIDISAHVGTPVRATGDGVVVFRGWDGAYGNTIVLDHGHGYLSKYAHLSRFQAKYGEFVRRGDIIGAVGTTGITTGPHLHYEVKLNGEPVNPKRFLLD